MVTFGAPPGGLRCLAVRTQTRPHQHGRHLGEVTGPARRSRRRALARALVVLAAVLVADGTLLAPPLAAAPMSPGASPPGGGLLGTPLLSPARLPETLQALAAGRRLDAAVASAMSSTALGAGAAANSCAEVAQDGHVLYTDHPDLPVIPASNMKLVTAAALLDKLGATYRFQTSLMALHEPVHGVINGDLYLVGGGDPVLRLPSDAPPAPARRRTRTSRRW